MITAHCPKCGSDDIREKNVAYAELPVTDWEVEDGELQPRGYDSDVTVDWEVEDCANQYVCAAPKCDWNGALDALIVKDDEEPDDV